MNEPSNQFPPVMTDGDAWREAWQRSVRLQRALREQTKLHPAIRVSETEAPKSCRSRSAA